MSPFLLSKVILMSMRIPEDVIHILDSPCWRWYEWWWEFLKMPYTSSFLLVECDSNDDENTWRCHTHPSFSLSKVIWMTMRIPEDAIHNLVSPCWRWLERWWEYLKMPYISLFLLVEGDSNDDENTWRCHTHSHFSLSKVIWMPLRIPENALHILVSPCRRWFECCWEYLKRPYMSSISKVIRMLMQLHLISSSFSNWQPHTRLRMRSTTSSILLRHGLKFPWPYVASLIFSLRCYASFHRVRAEDVKPAGLSTMELSWSPQPQMVFRELGSNFSCIKSVFLPPYFYGISPNAIINHHFFLKYFDNFHNNIE